MNKLLSICIPTYNRPNQLIKLLESIDCNISKVEIIICENHSPSRELTRLAVNNFIANSKYRINYFENSRNLGYDGNLRKLAEHASADYIMFIGDDDLFIPGSLDKFISFLKKNCDKPYILRTYLTKHADGSEETFRYLRETTPLPFGEKTVAWLFKRSVTICGFTISRLEALKYSTNELDGTLLYQVYLMAQVCLKSNSIYCDIPIAYAIQSFRDDSTAFGSAQSEKKRFTIGSVSHDNSINFAKAYFEVTNYLDKIHGTNLTNLVRLDLSKYSYPFLSIQRKRGVSSFLRYAKRLEIELGFGVTVYFFIYKWALVFFGEKVCDRLILHIKRFFGRTPNF